MPFQKGHGRFRTNESYRLAAIKIAKNPNSAKTRFKKGLIPWSKSQKGIHLSPKSEFKKGMTPWNKGKKYLRGKRHWNWKGGITPFKKSIRESLEYSVWRNAVFERDEYTCVLCFKKGGILNADHIKMFAYHPELRFVISNGRTLCQSCHLKLKSSQTRKHICCE